MDNREKPEEIRNEPEIFDKRCAICKHESRNGIEAAYLSWITMKEIAESYSITTGSIVRHGAHSGLHRKRADNYRGALKALVSRGIDNVKLKISDKAVVMAAEALAKIDGAIKTGSNQTVNIGITQEDRMNRLKDAVNRFGVTIDTDRTKPD